MKRVLIILLVLSTLLVIASCKQAPPAEQNTTTGSGGGQTADPVETGDPNSDELPAELTFQTAEGPAEFQILTQDYHAAITDFIIDETTTNIVEQAVYHRNAEVEERLGIAFDFKQAPYNQTNDTIRALDMSNEPVDLISARASWAVLMLTEGTFGDWNEVPYIHMDKKWWNQKSIDALSVNGKSYVLQGDINPSFISHTGCLYFNKNLFSAYYPTANIFDLVNNYEWNYDKFLSLVKDIWISLDDAKDTGDTFGFVAQSFHFLGTVQFAFEMNPMAKTQDGFPILNVDIDKWSEVTRKMYSLFYETEGVYVDKTWVDYRTMFAAGRAMFASGVFAHALLGYYADMTDGYAIVPAPMYDDTQETYYTMVDKASSSIYFMKSVPNREMLGAVCEALAANSYKNISPNIYEVALKYRYSTSEEQMEMIDFIHNGVTVDFGFIYNVGPMLSTVVGDNASNNFVSYYENLYNSWDKKIGDFIEFYITGEAKGNS